MTDQTYNGWTNWETWATNLHFDNYFQDDAEAILEECEYDKYKATNELAELIESTIDQVFEDSESGNLFIQDVLSGFGQRIDYHEIASHYIDEIPVWGARWNLPGCMPEMEPAMFSEFSDAKQFILDELERAADDADAGDHVDTANDISLAAEDVNLEAGEFCHKIGSYVYVVEQL